jgi:mono/diheme cytochrome c family protein
MMARRFGARGRGEHEAVGRVTAALLTGLVAVALLGGCGGGNGDGGDAADTTIEPTPGSTVPGPGNAAAGKEIFSDAGCGNCHVLEEAGSSGTTGPNLDEEELEFAEVVEQVREGGGGMPSFEGDLSPTEINDVSAFVAESSG